MLSNTKVMQTSCRFFANKSSNVSFSGIRLVQAWEMLHHPRESATIWWRICFWFHCCQYGGHLYANEFVVFNGRRVLLMSSSRGACSKCVSTRLASCCVFSFLHGYLEFHPSVVDIRPCYFRLIKKLNAHFFDLNIRIHKRIRYHFRLPWQCDNLLTFNYWPPICLIYFNRITICREIQSGWCNLVIMLPAADTWYFVEVLFFFVSFFFVFFFHKKT